MGNQYLRPRKPINVELTPVQVRFIQAFSDTMDFQKACKVAQVAPTQARKFIKEPNVKAAIDDIMGVALEEAKINASRVAEEYAVMAFSNILDIIEVGENGDTIVLKDLSALPRQFQACIQEVSMTPTKYGNALKVKLYDKMPALNKLASLTNLDKKDESSNKGTDYIEAKAEELMAVADAIRRKQQGLIAPTKVDVDVAEDS